MQVQTHGQRKNPRSSALYPQRWTIRIPTLDLTLSLEPMLAEQELITDIRTRVT